MTARDLLHNHRQGVLEVAHKHGVKTIRVFGSVAREEDSESSDIDLLVTTEPVVSSWFPAGLAMELEELLGRNVDIVTENGLNPLLRDRVLSEAIEL